MRRACGAGNAGWSRAVRLRCGGARPAGGKSKLTDTQVQQVRQALEAGAEAHGFDTDLWTLERVSRVVTATTGVGLSRA